VCHLPRNQTTYEEDRSKRECDAHGAHHARVWRVTPHYWGEWGGSNELLE
jgi:hypothetical protein